MWKHAWHSHGRRFVSELSLFLFLSVFLAQSGSLICYLLNLLIYLHSLVISLRVVIQSNVSQSI